jgi:hypothetical protein
LAVKGEVDGFSIGTMPAIARLDYLSAQNEGIVGDECTV